MDRDVCRSAAMEAIACSCGGQLLAAVAACLGPLLEVDLAEVWGRLVRMGDATPKGYGGVGRVSSEEEIREEMSCEEAAVWQREVIMEMKREEEEESSEEEGRARAGGVDRALVGRNPAVRRGKGMLELFSLDGGLTAAEEEEALALLEQVISSLNNLNIMIDEI